MSKRILIVLSEWGYWGEELLGPLETFDNAGYQVDFATPTGKRPVAITASLDPDYVDPPLGRSVTTPEVAEKARALDGSNRLDTPISLANLLPDRPYRSSHNWLREQEAYFRALAQVQRDLTERYDAILLVGGAGPIVDMVNNFRVHDLILTFYGTNKLIGAECYGVPCLAFARDQEDRRSIIQGKHVTGHCIEYDYKEGTGFMGTDFIIGPPPYPLEYILRDATAPGGQYHGNFGKPTSVIVDYPFVTGRSTPDSYLTGQKMVDVLEHGLRRWGF
jgi:putative intracellular protease/amidase